MKKWGRYSNNLKKNKDKSQPAAKSYVFYFYKEKI